MKKYFLSIVALAGMLFATSCQESLVEPQMDGTTTFIVQLPDGMGTKAYGDEASTKATINRLYVEVYSKDGNTLVYEPSVITMNDATATVTLNLVSTQEYDIIFWAQNEFCTYDVTDLSSVKMNANHHNSETGAAFYAVLNDYTPINGQQGVTLTRPFAQLNLGTTTEVSYVNANGTNNKVTIESAKITVKGVAPSFDRINGQTYGEGYVPSNEVTYIYENTDATTNFPKAAGEIVVVGKTYQYVSMDYFAVPGGNQSTVQVTAEITVKDPNGVVSTITRVIENVPVQLNYKTNIVGNLITSATEFEVIVEEAWKGTNDKEVEFREVATAQELEDAIEAGVDNITLTNDIDLTETLEFGVSAGTKSATTSDAEYVLDLNGKTINVGYQDESKTKHIYAFTNNANLTIKGNGTINARGTFNYGTLLIENGVTINAIDGDGGYAVRNYAGAEFIMNGGTLATTNEDDNKVNNGGYDATTLRVDEGATATINGGVIRNICDFTFAIDNAGTTTVNGGKITSVHSTVSSEGNLTINGGSFTCNGIEGVTAHALVVWDGSKTTINGGEFDGKDNYNGFNVDADEGSVVYIYGGKFLPVHSGSLYGEGTIIVSGGIFFDEIATERLAEGYCILPYTQGYYSVVAESNIVTTEEQLKACVERGGDIVLNADIALSSTLIIEEGADVSINLNKNTITGSWPKTDGHIINNNGNLVLLNGTVSSEGVNGGSAVYNAGKITIEEMILNGASDTENDGYPSYPINNYGDMILTSTTINGYHGAVACNAAGTTTLTECTINKENFKTSSHVFYINHADAKVVVNSGTYTHKGMDGSLAYVNKGRITVNGGEFTAKDGGYGIAPLTNGEVIINGGTFNNAFQSWGGSISVLGGQFKNDPSNWLAEGFVADEVDDVWVVSSANVKIEGNVYSSLQNAVNGAKDGQTITLLNDIEQEDGVLIENKNITIDLNGKTYTVTEGASTNNRNFKINGSSEVTIKNGTMVAAGDYSSGAYGTLRTEGTANVTLYDVKLYNYRGNGLNVKALSGTTVAITNTEIYSVYGGGVEAAGGIIELTDVKVEQKGMYTAPYNSMTISVNGGGQVTVNSGTYSTECITAEEANNQGSSHGPWCAGVLNSGGTLIIKGGTFLNDNFGENSLATAARGLLLADTGANIQIEGGTFNAVKAIIDIQNNLGDASKNPKALLNGGDYSSNPLTWEGLISLGEGKTISQDENTKRWIIE